MPTYAFPEPSCAHSIVDSPCNCCPCSIAPRSTSFASLLLKLFYIGKNGDQVNRLSFGVFIPNNFLTSCPVHLYCMPLELPPSPPQRVRVRVGADKLQLYDLHNKRCIPITQRIIQGRVAQIQGEGMSFSGSRKYQVTRRPGVKKLQQFLRIETLDSVIC